MSIARPRNLRGLRVVDGDGETIGKVLDTYPYDGSGEVEMVLVAVGRRLPYRRWLPAGSLRYRDGRLRATAPMWQIKDAPEADDNRWGDPPQVAQSYWNSVED